mgnify:CR=1
MRQRLRWYLCSPLKQESPDHPVTNLPRLLKILSIIAKYRLHEFAKG